jgi:hypothetical protein
MVTGNRLWALRLIPHIMLLATGAVQPRARGDDECGLPHVGVGLVNKQLPPNARRPGVQVAAHAP